MKMALVLQRTVFAFTPISAPYKATVFPLLQRAELDAPATAIAARLRAAGLSTKIDTTSASRWLRQCVCSSAAKPSTGMSCNETPPSCQKRAALELGFTGHFANDSLPCMLVPSFYFPVQLVPLESSLCAA